MEENSEPRELALLTESRRLLAEATTINEVKLIRDKAEALRAYAKQQGESREIQIAAAELKIRAERRAGEILREMPKNFGARGKGVPSHDASTLTLSDLGITHSMSSRWQRVAEMPEEVFEEHIAAVKADPDKDLTTAGVLRRAAQERSPPDQCIAFWSIHDASVSLSRAVYKVSQKWPAEHKEVMAHQLRSLADELMEFGELRPC